MWKRMFGRRDVEQENPQSAQADGQAQPVAQPARNQAPLVTLRPMTQAEYEQLRSWMDEDYAHEVAKAMGISIDMGGASRSSPIQSGVQ